MNKIVPLTQYSKPVRWVVLVASFPVVAAANAYFILREAVGRAKHNTKVWREGVLYCSNDDLYGTAYFDKYVKVEPVSAIRIESIEHGFGGSLVYGEGKSVVLPDSIVTKNKPRKGDYLVYRKGTFYCVPENVFEQQYRRSL